MKSKIQIIYQRSNKMNSPGDNELKVKPEINLNVDAVTALNLTVMEFDKKITEAESVVADLKKQRAAYIYDTNVGLLVRQAQQQGQSPMAEMQSQQSPSPEIKGQSFPSEVPGAISEVMSGPVNT
jgi:hypothetical protein